MNHCYHMTMRSDSAAFRVIDRALARKAVTERPALLVNDVTYRLHGMLCSGDIATLDFYLEETDAGT
jgi:hypothetical protein